MSKFQFVEFANAFGFEKSCQNELLLLEFIELLDDFQVDQHFKQAGLVMIAMMGLQSKGSHLEQ